MTDNPPPMPTAGTKWRHYKGAIYEIVGWATRTDNGGTVIVYKDELGEMFVREMGEFHGYTEDHRKRFVFHSPPRAATLAEISLRALGMGRGRIAEAITEGQAARDEGRRAAGAGLFRSDNPYPVEDDLRRACWDDGYSRRAASAMQEQQPPGKNPFGDDER